MIGAIAGDIIGSVYEHYPIKTKDFPLFDPQCRFTDDSVLTVAIAEAFYGEVPSHIQTQVKKFLTSDLWEITQNFCREYIEK